ncbi:hypothetical protein LOAG_11870 [Loa loa]|uniref:Uncharacterized protein n=1 Tax=Loa loa TaxID=7209 RepID=A0A1S0TMD0_LOALO|nr:hypothetical protein LOAG_11870 [Loa loa]EFO16637.1 hypothetical protein LOAG_11870 [Loa loa]
MDKFIGIGKVIHNTGIDWLVSDAKSIQLIEIEENFFPSSIDSKLRNDKLTIELGVFIDDALWIYYQQLYDNKADLILQNYAFAIVNNVQFKEANILFLYKSN